MIRPLALALALAPLAAAADSTDHFSLTVARNPTGRTLIKVVEPEGALVEIYDAGRRVFADDVPCSFDARGEKYYRVSVRKGDKLWERKIPTRPGEIATLAVSFEPLAPPPPPRPAVMSDESFKALLIAVENTRIYKDKVSLVRSAARANWYEAGQLGRIIDLTPLSMDKMEMLRVLKDRLVDPENAFKVYGHLKLDGDKRRAKDILEPPAAPLAP